jgi:hypothetical protein
VTDTAPRSETTPPPPAPGQPEVPVDPEPPASQPPGAPSTADIAAAGPTTDAQGEAAVRQPPAAPVGPDRAERGGSGNGRHDPLFDEGATGELRRRWDGIQTGFVDEPRGAVQQADTLVAECIQRLADTFARERQGLEQQWSSGDDVSTEDLRQALRRYRSFFDRLLSI